MTAEKKLTVKVGNDITLTMNGETGEVSLQAKKVSVKANDEVAVESSSKAQFKGSNVTLEGSGGVKIASSGKVEVAGMPIKLG